MRWRYDEGTMLPKAMQIRWEVLGSMKLVLNSIPTLIHRVDEEVSHCTTTASQCDAFEMLNKEDKLGMKLVSHTVPNSSRCSLAGGPS